MLRFWLFRIDDDFYGIFIFLLVNSAATSSRSRTLVEHWATLLSSGGSSWSDQLAFQTPFRSGSKIVREVCGQFVISISAESNWRLKRHFFTGSKLCSMWIKLGLHRCWWRMLETKCVDDNLKMWGTVLAIFVTNIHYLVMSSKSPTSTNRHELLTTNITVTTRPILRRPKLSENKLWDFSV